MAGESNKRELILDAAASIVETDGARHLTIDAVARTAGVSKGGVLYHFPSKRALLEGMLQRLLDQQEERASALREAHPDSAHPALHAWIVAERDQSQRERAMARSILAAAAEDPDLLQPARRAVKTAFADAGTTAPPERGWVALLAIEGLRFLEMLKLLPLTHEERSRVHEELLRLVEAAGE